MCRRSEQPSPAQVVGWILMSGTVLAMGCGQEMDDQPRLEVLEGGETRLLRDISRQPPEHTVPTPTVEALAGDRSGDAGRRSRLREGTALDTGAPQWGSPEELDALLHRGQSRFEIFCAPCHGLTGDGYGMVPRRGFPFPPSYHTPRLRSKPLRYIFAVATHGRGAMPPYGDLLSTEDRWAVAAYVRTLQLSQSAPAEWLSAPERERVEHGFQRQPVEPL